MIAKIAGVIMAVVGGWYAHSLVVQYFESGGGADSYWSEQGVTFVTVLLTVLGAAASGVATYYILNFFRRFD